MAGSFAFEGFVLDTAERRLVAGQESIELNGRYLDALALLVRDCGKLVPKERFLDEVWRGVPVTDEALTQCIKTLRRKLGDDAARPRFIETVPKHGYRFIAPVQVTNERAATLSGPNVVSAQRWRDFIVTFASGVGGGGVAGVFGGLIYGFAVASEPLQTGPGALSVLLVLLCVTIFVALIGAAGVCIGIALANVVRRGAPLWSVFGGAAGGLVVGAFGKLLGTDAFSLLVGRSPGSITGASEGALIGFSVGIAAWLAARSSSVERAAAIGAAAGGTAGVVISILGGRLMLGSLELLAAGFPGSRLRLDELSRPFAGAALNRVVHVAAAGLEAGLFAACVVGAMTLAHRRLER